MHQERSMSPIPTIHLQSTVVQVQSLLANEIDTEVMLLDMNAEKYYGMDGIGSRIWHLLAQPCQIAHICDALLAEFEVDPVICERDVLEFVQQLSDARLVEIVDA